LFNHFDRSHHVSKQPAEPAQPPSSQRQSPAGQQQAEQSTGGNTHRPQGARNDADTHAQGREQKQQGSRDSHKSQP